MIDRLAIPLAVTTLERGRSLYEVDLRRPCAWLFGNEGRGVAEQWLAQATVRIHPQEPLVESLNVAAAAAICLFEQRRQQLVRAQ
ncbi:TrmH family RNA methyltransferase OS=Castellaniella defragrans OX=75697 GN=HNR28_002400 PE=4 SV=1 [Castellaniella defragrans]